MVNKIFKKLEISKLTKNMRSFENYKDLIFVLTQKEMKLRYKNNVLGYLWSIANPLAFAIVFYIAFKVFMRIKMENYQLFLITGLFPWQWFSNVVISSPMMFLGGNGPIIKKVNFPKSFIPLAVVLRDTIHFILSIPVIVLFLFIYHKSPSISWTYGVPLLLFIQALMIYGISLIVSSINLFFRDLEKLVTIFMTLIFYFTPIIYPVSMIPERYQYLIKFHPLAPLIINWKNLFLNGTLDSAYLIISLAYSIVFFTVGYLIFKRLSWRFAEAL